MRELHKALITFCLLTFANMVIVVLFRMWEETAFDYCVTHICGMTHMLGLQDMVWTFTPLFLFLVPLYYGFSVLKKLPGDKQ